MLRVVTRPFAFKVREQSRADNNFDKVQDIVKENHVCHILFFPRVERDLGI